MSDTRLDARAQGDARAPSPGADEAPSHEPRRLLWGTVAVQASRAAQMLGAIAVTTVLARNFSLAEFGVYGLTLSFVTYIGFARSAVDASATKVIAEALDQRERDRAFTTAVVVFGAMGLVGGLLLALLGNVLIDVLHVPHRLVAQSRGGLFAMSALIAVGWPVSAFASLLYGEQRFKIVAASELAAQLIWTALLLVLVLPLNAPLWLVIAAGSSMLLWLGLLSGFAAIALRLPYRLRPSTLDGQFTRRFLSFAGYIVAGGATEIIIYGMDRTVLGIFRPAATIGLYEGLNRPYSFIRQVTSTLLVTVFPTTARYLAEDDQSRVRALLLRGSRYVAAATLPPVIALMILAKPLLVGWLGPRYGAAGTALTIFLTQFLVMTSLGVGSSMIQAAGRVRAWAIYGWVLALINLALSLALTSALGLDGVVLGTAIAYLVTYPIVLWLIVTTLPVTVSNILREVVVPCYSVGVLMGAGLLAFNAAVPIHGLGPVIASGAVACVAYWVLFWIIWLRPDERTFFRSLVLRPGVPRPAVTAAPRS